MISFKLNIILHVAENDSKYRDVAPLTSPFIRRPSSEFTIFLTLSHTTYLLSSEWFTLLRYGALLLGDGEVELRHLFSVGVLIGILRYGTIAFLRTWVFPFTQAIFVAQLNAIFCRAGVATGCDFITILVQFVSAKCQSTSISYTKAVRLFKSEIVTQSSPGFVS